MSLADPDPLLTLDELADRITVPAAFIRLAVDCGCPASDDRITLGPFADWVMEHYNDIRTAVGFEPLEGSDSIDPQESARVEIRNVLMTMSDYCGSRSSDPRMKRAWYAQSNRLSDDP